MRTQSRELVLGKSLSDFMRTLDIYAGGGNAHTKLLNQIKRLFGCTVSLIYEDKNGQASVNALIARRTEFWWNERKPDEQTLWESKIELSEEFFQRDHPLPGAARPETPSRPSSDVPWASISTSGWLIAPSRSVLRSASPGVRCTVSSACTRPKLATSAPSLNFRRKVLRELKKIKIAWPDLNYATAPGVLILLPSTPAFAPSDQGQLGR